MRAGRLHGAGLVFGLWLSLPQAAPGQSFVYTKVLDYLTPRPDGAGVFNINAITTPSFDGQWVVFRDNGPFDDVSLSSIWSYNIHDRTFHKLVALTTPVPGGTGTFSSVQLLDTAPFVRNGTVVFIGRDSNPAQYNQGIYAVPAAGGAVVKVADYQTADPSGGHFTVFDAAGKQEGGFSFDGTTVVFSAQGSTGVIGGYSALPNGSSLAMVADGAHPYHAIAPNNPSLFTSPAVAGNNVVVAGLDPSNGYNGLYLGTVGGNGALIELLNSNQALPGDPTANRRTHFDAPVLDIDSTLIVFRASDPNAASFFGLYTTNFSSHAITKIVDVNSTLPGLGRLTAIADGGVAMNQGQILFRAGDNTGRSGLYLWWGGTLTRIVGSGDLFDGQTVVSVSDPGPSALVPSGFVFNVDFAGGRALYRAAGTPMAVNAVASAANGATSSIAPGEIVTVSGTGIGPTSLTTFQVGANNRLATQLAGASVLFNGTPAPLIYVSDQRSAVIVPFGITGPTAQVVAEYNSNVSAAFTVPVTSTMPGLFAVNSAGNGQGVIQNADGSYNSAANPADAGTNIVLFATGLGALIPAPPDGSFIPAAGAPVLQFPVAVAIGGQLAQVIRQGPSRQQIAGLYEIECIIPAGTPAGSAAVVITSDGRPSQAHLTVSVR
jgi:uncharacterized protein (TIGR03437 family)